MNPMIAASRVALILLLFASCAFTCLAQQTTSFTYQGRLADGGTAANGNYDLQFALWDTVSGGAQIGTTQTMSNVAVGAGIFTVQLDFGANAFPGANRFLEIGARLSGGGAFTILSPRQPITPTPYAIRSLNASSADTVTVNGVPGGSGNYIQNATSQQAASNFNISGNGTAGGTLTAGVVNAATQYNLFGQRILSADFDNLSLFFGFGGPPPSTGTFNNFFGIAAGISNTSGRRNSLFGFAAGNVNSTGSLNSFFGESAGHNNTSGNSNSFFGQFAGFNSTGSNNSFFGQSAGINNVGGSNNIAIGSLADVPGSLTNATAIGANSIVTQSNSLVLGNVFGFNGATVPVNVGIGTTAPQARLDVNGTALFQAGNVGIGTANPQNTLHVKGGTTLEAGGSGGNVQFGTPNGETGMVIVGTNRADIRFDGSTLKLVAGLGAGAQPSTNGVAVTTLGRVGVDTTSPGATLEVKGQPSIAGFWVLNSSSSTGLVVRDDLTVAIGQLSSTASSTHVCIDGTSTLSFCTSSLRYKEQVAPYSAGLDLIRRLHPISFTWKSDKSRDLGLGAEDVAAVEPLLVTHNKSGEIQGVKYDQLNVVLINAIKQQQDQIQTLRAQNADLSARLRSVERIVTKRVSTQRRRR